MAGSSHVAARNPYPVCLWTPETTLTAVARHPPPGETMATDPNTRPMPPSNDSSGSAGSGKPTQGDLDLLRLAEQGRARLRPDDPARRRS
jgi:hypothetical protein